MGKSNIPPAVFWRLRHAPFNDTAPPRQESISFGRLLQEAQETLKVGASRESQGIIEVHTPGLDAKATRKRRSPSTVSMQVGAAPSARRPG